MNTNFWQGIYKSATEYAAYYISGWIIKFFPYIKERNFEEMEYDEEMGGSRVSEELKPNEFLQGDRYLLSTLSTDNFPSGIASIPVTWEDYFNNTTRKMEVFAGFMTIRQYPDKSLQPDITWAVCDADAPPVKEEGFSSGWQAMEHDPGDWVPRVVEVPEKPAVYDIKRFKTSAPSLIFVSKIIRDSLVRHPEFPSALYTGDTLQVLVLSNGKVAEAHLKQHTGHPELEAFITRVIRHLPNAWFPALDKLVNVLDVMDDEVSSDGEPLHEKLIKANSRVNVVLP